MPGKLAEERADIADWFYVPSWKRTQLPDNSNGGGPSGQNPCSVVFLDEGELGAKLVELLQDSRTARDRGESRNGVPSRSLRSPSPSIPE